MFKERNQRGRHRDDLAWRHINVVDPVRGRKLGLAVDAYAHEVAREATVLIELGVGLGDHESSLFDRR